MADDPNEVNEVEMLGISKHFAGIQALRNVNFSARRGEVHALMGENGAGKSTLMKILAGAYEKDTGEIRLAGKPVEIPDPKAGRDLGISVIYQEFALAPDLSVAENIFIDNMAEGGRFINWRRLYKDAQDLLDRLGFGQINVKAQVGDLSVAYQQVVEICKALSRKSSVLVFDEPTAVLTSNEVERLFGLIRGLRDQGVCIIYISHRLDEIFALTDRITVMKDGGYVGTVNTKDMDPDSLVTMMIGRSLSDFYPPRNATIGEVALRVENLQSGTRVNGISFEVRRGEVLGINGLVDAGRTETMRAIFGAEKLETGHVYYNGNDVRFSSPKKAVRSGIGKVPEDRKNAGVLLDLPISQNITLANLKSISGRFGRIDRKKEEKLVNELVDKLKIKIGRTSDSVSTLSGGNQQKVALAKWLGSNSQVLIFDEPTRGVDVGAKVEIYRIINALAEEGVAIIMVSSEMPEIIGMSDRVVVMREGRAMCDLSKPDSNEENMIKLAMGVTQ